MLVWQATYEKRAVDYAMKRMELQTAKIVVSAGSGSMQVARLL